MLRHQFNELLFPPEVLAPEGISANKPATAKTADDINDLFNELDKEPQKPEKSEKPQKPEKESEKELEVEEEPDDDLELVEPEEEIEKLDLKEDKEDKEDKDNELEIDTPPRKREILKEYPELFKKFPFLEKMLYRDKQYNELFGSFDDARELANKAEIFNSFESQLLSGKTEEILKEVKSVDENAFNTIVDDYLPTLAKVDKEAYFHVVGNLNRRLIMEMVQEANDTNNDDLKQAALLVNQFIFGTSKFTPPTARQKENKETKDNAERSEVEQERLSLVRERFESARDDLQSKVDNTLRATISDYIDPRGNMTAYVKKNAVADAMNILNASISSDPSVINNLDRLWRSAFETKFSRESLNKIQSFYLSKAKVNLKNAILKARSEALKDLPPRRKSDENEEENREEENSRRAPRTISAGRPSQPKKNEMKKGESVADFFARD